MSDMKKLSAVARDRVGKGAARAIRRQGYVPAVVYGVGQPPKAIAIQFKEAQKLIYDGGFMTTMFEIDIEGDKERVIPRDYQLEPVKDMPIHIDFFRVAKGQVVAVEVPVHFLNQETCVGIKRGGTLNVVRHTVELNVPADAIPDAIEIDIQNLEMGDTLHISAVTLPKGCSPVIDDRDFTIATIATPAGFKEEAEEGEAEGGEEEGKE
ncbi:50S ribosomal protein L25/general stress protein Ctc [Saliniramus sp.]|uniref:50S ribosomal protein L25/general stress protein Ctc n=1 Tax=Saliniramus sp. TaxID=2986772 RepID=UPI002D1363F3|nr:50S ribosomal protein L25/general stress protein Ctc [Saliniramus sp.]HMB10467.1 50S ribosomal protein L25/general stress protein Ctc [Saliniramus sp.]